MLGSRFQWGLLLFGPHAGQSYACVSWLGAWAQEWIDTLARIDKNRRGLLLRLLAFEPEILAGVEYRRLQMIDSSGCLAVEQSALVDRNK